MSTRSLLRSLVTPAALIRLAIAIGASVGLFFLIDWWIGGRTSITLDPEVLRFVMIDRPIDLLAPQWLLLASRPCVRRRAKWPTQR